MTTAIEVRDLFRVYSTPEGDAAALQGLSLRVREREVLAVLGPSGSGKTTLLRILAGLERPSAGTVRVLGTELSKLSAQRLSAYRTSTLGYADQHYARALAPELTARELVTLQLGLRGEPRRLRAARADELLARVGLADRAGARPRELSGGEQQRLAVCAAIAHRPPVLLADEPTGELDHANAQHVYRLLGELSREHGCTTVIVSHDPESAAVADRIVRIRDGRVSEEFVRAEDEGDTIVVGRGGWLRLPEELLHRAGIGTRATARLEGGRIVVGPARGAVAPAVDTTSPPEAADGAAPSGGPVAELRAVTKRYGRTAAVASVSGTFDPGRLHVVTGPSGSGKTTLLHLLAGLELPTEGEISVLGTAVSRLDRAGRARFRRAHVGFVAQQPRLLPFLSSRENVELTLTLRGADPAEASARALDALDAVGLGERAEQRVGRLSTGEQARVAVARALAPRPVLLLADEPTSRLDQANAITLGALFSRLVRERGTTIVCATHDPVVIEQADEELRLG